MADEDNDVVMGDSCLTDEESSFYGDDDTKKDLESRVQHANVAEYWRVHPNTPATIAFAANKPNSDGTISAEGKGLVHYPHDGDWDWRQSHEKIEDFLERLPPSKSTEEYGSGPWVWVHNPYVDRDIEQSWNNESVFKHDAEKLRTGYDKRKEQIEGELQGNAQSAITRKLRSLQEQLDKDLKQAAADHEYVSGKWMLFPSVNDVDRYWHKVAEATWQGQLGPVSKVAKSSQTNKEKSHLICVYTRDFRNLSDVKRVLDVLVRLLLVDKDDSRGIWYKSDAYTVIGIYSGNAYGLKASMYGSREMLRTAA